MIAAAVLAGYATVVGWAAPAALARARWAHRSPKAALALWRALMLSFVIALALTAYHLTRTGQHLHGLLGVLDVWLGGTGTPATERAAEGPGLLVPIALAAAWPLAWFGAVLVRSRSHRRRHLALLDLAGRPEPRLHAVVLEHDTPAAYCLPGPQPRVVLTSGTLAALTPDQLHAVLEHERAHLRGRHHLSLALTEGFARAFPGLPLARAARTQTADLLEMVADDHALRSCTPKALAAAMCEVAAGGVPQTALAAGGPTVLLRLKRLLRPRGGLHPAARTALLLLALCAPALPYFVTCGPTLG
ncbi:M56 family metallopeptidase [Kitasatospora sp. GP82]|uniref:M56 family metallopeptidase n=1 Tax=Kitasatospora sp. GP82 TaxID=3035089 RepID=UPI002473DDCF|nr:M56 family metallopeptidase [Kitasatospora sp. GP82]MDH6129547.1 Zn-dependent protease with chaperone function [Kitasatospora sp. GP82]